MSTSLHHYIIDMRRHQIEFVFTGQGVGNLRNLTIYRESQLLIDTT